MDLKIFTENVEPEALSQIYELAKIEPFKDCKIRIMPDVHAGSGCVIGFTANLGDKVIPNIVGVDIGCGMLTTKIAEREFSFEKLDEVIRKYVPSGKNVRDKVIQEFPKIKELYCYSKLRNKDNFELSIGTLGGGNHFIEVDKDQTGFYYLVIHSGSRNLGKQVADFYQKLAIQTMRNPDRTKERDALIARYKKDGREREIADALKSFNVQIGSVKIPDALCYLEGEQREQYLHDMKICQEYAVLNRKTMAEQIIQQMHFTVIEQFETIHNYIEHDTNMVRKGAISAKENEKVLIPMNMRDGCLICIGKGNPDWNYSAPHGAGRIMSRSKAKERVSFDEFKDSMKGIYTTSVLESTIDESPMVYKAMDEIIQNISDTVDIIDIIKPVYNFKAS